MGGGPPACHSGSAAGGHVCLELRPAHPVRLPVETTADQGLSLERGQWRAAIFQRIPRADPTGLCDMSHILLSADGRAYVYSYMRMLSELYMVKGLK